MLKSGCKVTQNSIAKPHLLENFNNIHPLGYNIVLNVFRKKKKEVETKAEKLPYKSSPFARLYSLS